ncbi:MAG: chromatin modification- protein VID21 [Vezdaea aestivalis]|nr:MAG: chromatin modification- protein VID21 [Vezdaea aestivalis]
MISHREGILGSKSDELSSLLRSRKRKLSQLYDVTAASFFLSKIPTDDTRLKFFELNDIEKGRPFDEATLPPFYLTLHNSTTDTSVEPKNTPSQLDSHGSPSNRSNSPSGANLTRGRPKHSPGDIENPPDAATNQSKLPKLTTSRRSSPGISLSTSFGRSLDKSPRRKPNPAAQDLGSGPSREDELPVEDWERRRTHTLVESLPGSPGVFPARTEQTNNSNARRRAEAISRPPLQIPTKTNSVDILSTEPTPTSLLQPNYKSVGVPSPSSTVGPYSANTPAANGPSSDTSPEDQSQLETFSSTHHLPHSKAPEPASQEHEELDEPLRGTLRDLDKLEDGRKDNSKDNTALSLADVQLRFENSQARGKAPDEKKIKDKVVESNVEPQKTGIEAQKALAPLPTRPSSSHEGPSKPTPTTARSPPERMTTRVSSGAIRHRSVSEILGGPIGKTPLTPTEPAPEEPERTDVIISPMSRMLMGDRRERDRPKHAAVIFGDAQKDDSSKVSDNDDYLLTLFAAPTSVPSRSPHLNRLLASAPKVITTSDHMVDVHEQQDCRILKKIYQLQWQHKWPLRQMIRSKEPPRQATHWDALLGQVKWMRTDFREERKWKLVMASNLAHDCARYVNASPEDQQAMQVRVRRLQSIGGPTTGDEFSQPTPDLVHSDGMSIDSNNSDFSVPAQIFSLSSNEVTFELKNSAAGEKLLSELPLYAPPGTISMPSFPPSTEELPEILPVSRFVKGKIVLDVPMHPRKRSRYDFAQGDSPEPVFPADDVNVALFNPESRSVLDRIHSGHAFRPPSEFNMPSTQFYESRSSSQWMPTEDDELRALVKEYQYNWALISSILTPSTLYTSGAERRTSWECFERWIGLEGLPAEMQKTAYFRAYSSRLAAAQKTLAREIERQTQQDRASGQGQPIRRQRTIQPLRVERRKQTKHLAIIDAMRKLAKKREAALQKQRDTAGLHAMRKAQENPHHKVMATTPAEFSRMKHEREIKFQEAYKNELLRAKNAAAQQQRAAAQANGMPQQQRANGNTTAAAHNAALAAQQGRPQLPGQALPNGLAVPNGNLPSAPYPVQYNGVPQAPMQNGMVHPQLQRFQPSSPDGRLSTDAQRMQATERHRAAQRMAMQQLNASMRSGSASSPSLPTSSMAVQQNLAALQQTFPNPQSSPNNPYAPLPVNLNRANPNNGNGPLPLSSGHIPTIQTIQHILKARNPDLSPEQLHRLSNEQLSRAVQQQAMTSAAGVRTSSSSPPVPGLMGHHPSQQALNGAAQSRPRDVNEYTRQMRAQQANQSGGGSSAGRPDSRGAASNGSTAGTPGAMNQQSPQLQHVQMQSQS